jgi:hypothetical protein
VESEEIVNIFKAWKLWRKVGPFIKLIREASVSKNILRSKIFWVNVLTAAVELSGALGGMVPPGALQLTTNVLNILLRLITNQPVTVLPTSTEE